MKRTTAIVLAAGVGKRMNTSVAKQFLILRDKPVLYYSLKAFQESNVDNIILVTGKEYMEYCRDNIVASYRLDKVSHIIEGGQERYDSVYGALKMLMDTNYVLIHDGARPFVSTNLINCVIDQVNECKACIVGTPVKETIKVVNQEGDIISTPQRETLWSAQTPQAFEYEAIKRAYNLFYEKDDMGSMGITDDAMVYETFLNKPVKMLLGEYHNLKLTTPEDIILAETIYNKLLYENNKKKEQFLNE